VYCHGQSLAGLRHCPRQQHWPCTLGWCSARVTSKREPAAGAQIHVVKVIRRCFPPACLSQGTVCGPLLHPPYLPVTASCLAVPPSCPLQLLPLFPAEPAAGAAATGDCCLLPGNGSRTSHVFSACLGPADAGLQPDGRWGSSGVLRCGGSVACIGLSIPTAQVCEV